MDAVSALPASGLSPDLWQALADNLPQLAWVAGPDGSIFWYNQRWYEFTGAEPEAMLGWGWKAVHHPAHVERVEERFRAAITAGVPWEDVFPLRGKDGDYCDFLSRAQPLRDAAGQITHWIGTNTDITRQQAAEHKARIANDHLRRAAEIASMFVWEYDGKTQITRWGENSAQILGIPESQLPCGPGNGLFFVAEEDRKKLTDGFAAAIAAKTEFSLEFRGLDGREWIADYRVTCDPEGSLAKVFGATRDITREAQQRRRGTFLLKLEDRLRNSVDAAAASLASATLIGQELKASRVSYAEVDAPTRIATVAEEYIAPGIVSMVGSMRLPDEVFDRYSRGEPLISEDIRTDPALNTAREDFATDAFRFRAVLDIPLRREGRLVAVLAIHDLKPRQWTDDEIALAIAAAERSWDTVERARAEHRLRLSEAQFRNTAEALPGLLFVTDANGNNVYVNHQYREYSGLDEAAVLGRGWSVLIHPDDLIMVEQRLAAAIASGEPFVVDYRIGRHDGAWRWHATRATATRDANGEVIGWVGVSLDIHDRREAEQRFRTVFNSAAVGIARVAPDGLFLEVNDRYCEILGRSREEVLGGGWAAITHPDDLEDDIARAERALSGEIDSFANEKRYLGKDGGDVWVNLTVSAQRNAGGGVQWFIAVIEDIADRKAAETALRLSEERYRALFESMGQGFCIVQVSFAGDQPSDYRFTDINPAFTEQSGIGVDVLNRSVRDAIPGLEDAWFKRYGEIAVTGIAQQFTEYAEPLGRWFEVYAFRIGDPADRNVAILFSDVTAQQHQQRALEATQAQLRAVIDAVPVGLVFADENGRITGGNARVEEIVGHPVLPSTSVEDYGDWVGFHVDGRKVEGPEYPLAKVILEGVDQAELDVEYQRGDQRRSWIRFSAAAIRNAGGELIGGVVASIDIDREKRLTESLEREVEKVVAEREAAQEALRQSQKLEAMGQLTGGVAHDFNNLLTPIIGSLDLIQRKQVLDARTGRLVDGALASAEKARVLVQRLLAFARRQPLQPQAIDLARIVTEMSELIASTSGPRVRVEVDIADHLPPALADGNQLEMALLNLSVNARDAMPDGGTLTIAVREEGGQDSPGRGNSAPQRLILSVSDTGTGMDEVTRRRAIEPFFSTKGIGKGTGLGLSMVHGLAAQLGGSLDIRSAPGVGTTIELRLPIAATTELPEANQPLEKGKKAGAGTALLVDDEELVRAATASMLADLGFEVVEAASGEDALAHVEAGLAPDLLVTDQLMPGLSGTDLAGRLRERLAGLPVLIVSGYADLESLSPSYPHLSKPFRQAALLEALQMAGVKVTSD